MQAGKNIGSMDCRGNGGRTDSLLRNVITTASDCESCLVEESWQTRRCYYRNWSIVVPSFLTSSSIQLLARSPLNPAIGHCQLVRSAEERYDNRVCKQDKTN